jgi:phosphatidylglycerol:prolipoprotein diacylglycerol transferase
MLYAGLVLGLAAGNVVANARGLDAGRIYVSTLLLLIPALIGARLSFVAAHWSVYRREPRRIWRRSEGGMAMLGGLPLAVPSSVPLLAALGVRFGAFWDVATITILVAMVVTRIGCLLNGCCWGRPTSSRWGLVLPDARGEWQRRVPTQVLEAAWAAVVLAVALAAGERLREGAVFAGGLCAYGLGRMVLELLREHTDRRHVLLAEAAPAVSAVCGIGVLWLATRG